MSLLLRIDRRQRRLLRRIPLIAGTSLATFWLALGLVEGMTQAEPLNSQGVGMAAMIITGFLATTLAWWRLDAGALCTILFAAGFAAFAYGNAGHTKPVAALITGGPFMVAGLMYLAAWWARRQIRRLENQPA